MGRIIRSCLQSLLKLVDLGIGMVGIAMILYSSWMLRVWQKNIGDSDFQPPWFIYTFLGLGITLCVITCSGHIAADTANGHCLSCYMTFVFLLVLLEAAVTADVFLNNNWEEDFPEDRTGRFDEFKDFVNSNFKICKWIASSIVAAQALSIFLAMILRALGPDHGSYYDSDDDYTPARVPLLRNQITHPPYVAYPHYALQNNAWNASASEKINS
ncbi:tetraspanin-19-like [Tasmannia lanceolata]|uniref:tetraspanin-19-like n=1 Tax=Tasmannia lanceolata TaxID=3420 RepID=UPI0040648A92